MKILVAVDGSGPSLVARDLVASLPWSPGTKVELLAAYEVPIDWTGGVGATMDWVGDIEDATRDELLGMLREAALPLHDAGMDVRPSVRRGRPPTVIVDAASELGVDLIVTGSRGRGPLKSMLLGSVASEVATHADVPVLVARAPTVERLIVATDGSPASASIVDRLVELAAFRDRPADVVAVNVPESPAFELIVGMYTLGQADVERHRADEREQAVRDAEAMATRLSDSGIPSTPHVRVGDAATEIVAAANAESDLIVVGSRGLSGIESVLLGSVARNVLTHARCSVLVVRGAPQTA
jgi:nucleotide-binding universal stress UspA family protein